MSIFCEFSQFSGSQRKIGAALCPASISVYKYDYTFTRSIRYDTNIQTNCGACPTMILNLDIHKCSVILTEYLRGEKFSP